ncbi:MAG: glycoside hydrolase family 2 protein [Paracoccaceae bacterium]
MPQLANVFDPMIDATLSGTWSLRDMMGDFQCDMAVPGDGVSALVAAGHLPDPYVGRNELDCRWVAERDWVLSREFTCQDTEYDLVLYGLDTVAEVSINGQVVLNGQNSFRRYVVDASSALKIGGNEIRITFRSSVQEAAERQAAQPYYVPYSEGNSPIPNGNMLRKVQCDFGWDWNIALAPFGITGCIGLSSRTNARITEIVVTQTHSKDMAKLSVRVTAERAKSTEVSICGVTKTVLLENGTGTAVLSIPDPDLWWPVGLGDQTLHQLTVTADDTKATRQIGLRDVEHINMPDAKGAAFKFRVNGHDTFMRGANWIPADALFSRITQDGVRDLLQSAIDANMNMIRIWGGGRYEPDWFYDLCDELGLMVWQDFMFSCSLYPSDQEFLDEVAHEVRDQVTRLNHHACIALWCGDNELVGALTWYPEARENRDRYLVAYDRLNRTIEATLAEVVPQANWWPSSPASGPQDFGDAWHDDSKGDMHFWSVWHEGRDFEHYRDVKPRFCSEFGFQSFPSAHVIRTFASPSDMNIASPVMEAHQKNAGGNARIAETMFRYFRFPNSFDDFVYLSQVQQGLAMRMAVEYWRSLQPHCMGTLYWQLNDTWPVASWSSLNHGGDWKLLHYMARRFYKPTSVFAIPDNDCIRFVAVNDTRNETDVSVEVFSLAEDGIVHPIKTGTQRVPAAKSKTILEISKPDTPLLWFKWQSDTVHGSDHISLQRYKSLDLLDPEITATPHQKDGSWNIDLRAQSLGLFVSLEADIPGRFSENAITLLPNSPQSIQFTPTSPEQTPQITVRDLYSATCAVPQGAEASTLRGAS